MYVYKLIKNCLLTSKNEKKKNTNTKGLKYIMKQYQKLIKIKKKTI